MSTLLERLDESQQRIFLAWMSNFTSTSTNYGLIKQGLDNLDRIIMYSFELYQAGKITHDDYHNYVTALMSTADLFKALEAKLVQHERPKRDKWEE